MLFHFAHVHTPEDCPAHKPEALKMIAAWVQSAEAKGVKIHSLHVAPWEHTYYGVLDADSAESLVQFVDPLLELGTAAITPVTDIVAELKRRLADS
jgi:hypothetical protein